MSSGGDGCGCTEGCFAPLGCLLAVVAGLTVAAVLLAAMTQWQFRVFVGVLALVVGLVKFLPWWWDRNSPPGQ